MKGFKLYISLVFCICIGIFGCTENEMSKYQEAPAVNFSALDENGEISDELSLLNRTYDFTDLFVSTLQSRDVLVKLQGYAQEKDLKVAFKVKPVEGYLTPDIQVLKNCSIPKGGFVDTLTLEVKRPGIADTTYMADLVFDYENSEVSAGTVERQEFRIVVYDKFKFSWEETGITPTDWEDYLQPNLGEPSVVKIHFILVTFEVETLADIYVELYYNASYRTKLREALDAYNAQREEPMKDENGKVVTFEPVS